VLRPSATTQTLVPIVSQSHTNAGTFLLQSPGQLRTPICLACPLSELHKGLLKYWTQNNAFIFINSFKFLVIHLFASIQMLPFLLLGSL
jgi:hypothetical protein